MFLLPFAVAPCFRRQALVGFLAPSHRVRLLHATSLWRNSSTVEQKYIEKLQKRAEEKGLSMDELKALAKSSTSKSTPILEAHTLHARKAERGKDNTAPTKWPQTQRKDNSPVKPLAEIMDIHKVLRKPHTAEQISTLWTAFHASRSGGTGRGYLSAAVPLPTYRTLLSNARKYPTFILPLLRSASPDRIEGGNDIQNAYEFYFMQWSFHSAPQIPPPGPFDEPPPEVPPPSEHPIATVLFTPLLEYKTRETFATPHLALTHYTDLANSHNTVLLRGELTASSSGNGRYLLSQHDAQLLALGLQRFYLADGVDGGEPGSGKKAEGRRERTALLRLFNEKPSEFRWEDLLKHADPTLP